MPPSVGRYLPTPPARGEDDNNNNSYLARQRLSVWYVPPRRPAKELPNWCMQSTSVQYPVLPTSRHNAFFCHPQRGTKAREGRGARHPRHAAMPPCPALPCRWRLAVLGPWLHATLPSFLIPSNNEWRCSRSRALARNQWKANDCLPGLTPATLGHPSPQPPPSMSMAADALSSLPGLCPHPMPLLFFNFFFIFFILFTLVPLIAFPRSHNHAPIPFLNRGTLFYPPQLPTPRISECLTDLPDLPLFCCLPVLVACVPVCPHPHKLPLSVPIVQILARRRAEKSFAWPVERYIVDLAEQTNTDTVGGASHACPPAPSPLPRLSLWGLCHSPKVLVWACVGVCVCMSGGQSTVDELRTYPTHVPSARHATTRRRDWLFLFYTSGLHRPLRA